MNIIQRMNEFDWLNPHEDDFDWYDRGDDVPNDDDCDESEETFYGATPAIDLT